MEWRELEAEVERDADRILEIEDALQQSVGDAVRYVATSRPGLLASLFLLSAVVGWWMGWTDLLSTQAWYVDPTTGLDGNSCTSPDAPCKTFSEVVNRIDRARHGDCYKLVDKQVRACAR